MFEFSLDDSGKGYIGYYDNVMATIIPEKDEDGLELFTLYMFIDHPDIDAPIEIGVTVQFIDKDQAMDYANIILRDFYKAAVLLVR